MEIEQPPPQVALSSGRGLVHTDRDACEGGVGDFHPRDDPSGWLGTKDPVEALSGAPDHLNVVVDAQPGLQRGLRTRGPNKLL